MGSLAPLASEQDFQVVSGDVFEDYDYAFRIERPLPDWRFLKEERAREVGKGAVAVLVAPGNRAFVAVFVYRIADRGLDEVVEFLFGEPSEGMRILEDVSQAHRGRPARRLRWIERVEGVEFTYRVLLVQRGDFFYQVTGWTHERDFPEHHGEIIQIADSLRFLESREPRLRSIASSGDEHGPDWAIRNGVYWDASFGIQLAPSEGFRLSGRAAVASVGPDARARLNHGTQTFDQVLFVRPAIGLDPTVRATESVLGTTPERRRVRVAGCDAEERRYRGVPLDGELHELAFTGFVRGKHAYVLESCWPSDEDGEARPLLAASYDHLGWMKEEERAALQDELLELDASSAVGPDFCYRNGVYRDFRYDFSLRKPPGLWCVDSGEAARAWGSDTRVHFRHAADGLDITVIAEHGDLEPAEYHRLACDAIGAGGPQPRRRTAAGGLEVLVTSLGGPTTESRLVTAARGERHLQAVLQAPAARAAELDQALYEVLRGLDLPAQSLAITEETPVRYVDHRLGFRLTKLPGSKFGVASPPQIEAVGTMAVCENAHGALVVSAVHSPSPLGSDFTTEFLRANSAVRIDPASWRESPSTLSGLSARRYEFRGRARGRRVAVILWQLRRGNTTYFAMVVGEPGSRWLRQAEEHRDLFALLD